MLEKILRRQVMVRGRPLEVMLDLEGKWRGMVHIYDPSLPKAGNRDMLVSGARYLFEEGRISVNAADDIFTKDVEFAVEAIAAAAVEIRRGLAN